jgi:hypothetical protein
MRPATNALPLGLVVTLGFATAGPLDPDCTAEKAAKSAAMKATVGVGGRCSPKEAAADTAKRKTGIDKYSKDKNNKRLLGRDKDGK